MVRRWQAADWGARLMLGSPGHSKFQRPVEVTFWLEIAEGLLPVEASAVVGVSRPVGQRWFHNAGGMPPFDLKFPLSGRYLSFAGREDIALFRTQVKGVRKIAQAMSRDPGQSRESHVAMLRSAPGAVDTERRSRGGRPIWLRVARRSRSWLLTRGCTRMR